MQPGRHCLPGHSQTVVDDTDKADIALLPGLLHGFVQAGTVSWPRAKGRIVELIDVDAVGIQLFQAGMQVVPEAIYVSRHDFGGQGELFPPGVEGISRFFPRCLYRLRLCRKSQCPDPVPFEANMLLHLGKYAV